MIIKIPFTASVSIRSITIKAGPSGQTPREIHIVRVYIWHLPPRTYIFASEFMRTLRWFGDIKGWQLMDEYRDSPGMDFSDTDRPATQVLEVVETQECAEYQLKWGSPCSSCPTCLPCLLKGRCSVEYFKTTV